MKNNNPFSRPKTSIAKVIGYSLFSVTAVLLTIALIAPHMGTTQKVESAAEAARELSQEILRNNKGS